MPIIAPDVCEREGGVVVTVRDRYQKEKLGPVKVDIDGDILAIRSSASEAHVKAMAAVVNKKILKVRQSHPNIPRHQAAILAALELADEVHRKTVESEEFDHVLEPQR